MNLYDIKMLKIFKKVSLICIIIYHAQWQWEPNLYMYNK